MSRCSKKRGIWVSKQCENAAFTLCTKCQQPACTEHLSISNTKQFVCVDCLPSVLPSYAIEDFKEGDIENFVYYMASLSQKLKNLQLQGVGLDSKIIPIEKLYNFDKYDALGFRQEYVQYYDDNDTSANLYDS